MKNHIQEASLAMIRVRKLGKTYSSSRKKKDAGMLTHALTAVSFEVLPGEFVGIMGPSGSGKSTLLNCLSTIDKPTCGRIDVDGRDITTLNSREIAQFRRDDIGFVFQDSNLLDTLSVFENIALALTIQKVPAREVRPRVLKIAEVLSIGDILDKYPYQISGGQKQRAAVARAVVTHPRYLLADEPTGALDSRASSLLLDSFNLLNDKGSTILMVTHDSFAASYCSRVLFMRDGSLYGDLPRLNKSRNEFRDEIMRVVLQMSDFSTSCGDLGESIKGGNSAY